MKGCTFDEFKEVIKSGWEMKFTAAGKEFFYERLSRGDTSIAHLSHMDSVTPFFNKKFNDVDELLEVVLSQAIVGEKTIADLEDDIEVTMLVR